MPESSSRPGWDWHGCCIMLLRPEPLMPQHTGLVCKGGGEARACPSRLQQAWFITHTEGKGRLMPGEALLQSFKLDTVLNSYSAIKSLFLFCFECMILKIFLLFQIGLGHFCLYLMAIICHSPPGRPPLWLPVAPTTRRRNSRQFSCSCCSQYNSPLYRFKEG